MHFADGARFGLPRGERRDFHVRMAQQELHQLERRVAGRTKNADANHVRIYLKTSGRAEPRIVATATRNRYGTNALRRGTGRAFWWGSPCSKSSTTTAPPGDQQAGRDSDPGACRHR